jgi:hypothetical protein
MLRRHLLVMKRRASGGPWRRAEQTPDAVKLGIVLSLQSSSMTGQPTGYRGVRVLGWIILVLLLDWDDATSG